VKKFHDILFRLRTIRQYGLAKTSYATGSGPESRLQPTLRYNNPSSLKCFIRQKTISLLIKVY